MREATVTYALRRFTRPSDPEFLKALHLYSRSIPPEWRTDTREITYWLNRFKAKYGDEFSVYGFYADGVLVGFAELVFLKKDAIILVDYVVIDEKHRKNNIFVQFVEHLREFLTHHAARVDYIVAEVGYLTKNDAPSDYSRTLMRLLKFVGFGVVKAMYAVPQLGFTNAESKMNATLMLMTPNTPPPQEIYRETFLRIVRAIYYDYYLRWYLIYPEREEEYRSHLDEVFKRVEASLEGKKTIRLNGTPYVDHGESGVKMRPNEAIRTAQVLLLFVLTTTTILIGAGRVLEIGPKTLVVIFLVVLASFFALLGLFSKRSLEIFDRIINLLRFFRRDK